MCGIGEKEKKDETVISGLRYGFSFYGRAEDEISRGGLGYQVLFSWQERDEVSTRVRNK